MVDKRREVSGNIFIICSDDSCGPGSHVRDNRLSKSATHSYHNRMMNNNTSTDTTNVCKTSSTYTATTSSYNNCMMNTSASTAPIVHICKSMMKDSTSTATTSNSSDTKRSSCCHLFRDSGRKQDIQIDAGRGSTNSHSNNTSDVHAAPNIPLLFSTYNCSWARAERSGSGCRLETGSLLYSALMASCWGTVKCTRKCFTSSTKSLPSQLALKSKYLSFFVVFLLLLLIQVNVILAEKTSSRNKQPHHDHMRRNSRNFMEGFDDNQKNTNHATNWDFENFFNTLPERKDQGWIPGAFGTEAQSPGPRDTSGGHVGGNSEGAKRHRPWRGAAHGDHMTPNEDGAHRGHGAQGSGALAPPGKHFAWKSAWKDGRKIPVLSIEPDGQRDRRSLAFRLQSYLHHRPRHNHSHGKIASSSSDQSHDGHLQTSASQDKTVGIPSGHHGSFTAKIPSSHHDGGTVKIPWNHSREGNVGTSDGDVRERRAKPPLRESHSSSKRERHPDITYSQNPGQKREAVDVSPSEGGGGSLEKSASPGDVDRRKRAWHTQEFPHNEEISAQNEGTFLVNRENLVENEFVSSAVRGSKPRPKHRKKHNQDVELDHDELAAGLVEEKNILRREMLKLNNLDEERKMIEKDMEAIEEDIEEILERERRSLQFRREKILRRRERRKMRKEKRRRRRMMRKHERQRNHAIRSEENPGPVNEELAISREFIEAERKKMREERRRKRIARRREKRRERRLRRRLRKRNKFKHSSKGANVVIDIVQFEQDTTNELHGHNACQYRDLLTCARETGLVAHPASAKYSLQTAPRCLQRKNFLECMERQRSGSSECSNSTTALGDLKRLRKHLRSAMFSNSSCLIAESIRS